MFQLANSRGFYVLPWYIHVAFSAEAAKWLLQYPWQGDGRRRIADELELPINVIPDAERCIVVVQGGTDHGSDAGLESWFIRLYRSHLEETKVGRASSCRPMKRSLSLIPH